MSSAKPVTNHALAELVGRSGLSLAAFARQVAAERTLRYGTVHAYDGSSAFGWLRGRVPEQEACAAMARVLGRKLGRQVDERELGFGGADWSMIPEPCPTRFDDEDESEHDPMERERRNVITGLVALGAGMLAAPAAAAASGLGGQDPSAAGAAAGDASAEVLWASARQLLSLDTRFGGAAVYAGAAALYRNAAQPVAENPAATPDEVAACGYLCQVVGYAAMDANDPGGTYEWLHRSINLAIRAKDPVTYTGAMTDLAGAAITFGQAEKAAQIARRAAEQSGAPSVYRARAYATEARALARAQDLAGTRRAAGRAEEAIDSGPGRCVFDHDTLSAVYSTDHLASELSYALADVDPAAALRYLDLAGATPPGMPRRAMAVAATRARALLALGQLDGAIGPARTALNGQAALPRSARVSDHAQRLLAAIAPHRDAHPPLAALTPAP